MARDRKAKNRKKKRTAAAADAPAAGSLTDKAVQAEVQALRAKLDGAVGRAGARALRASLSATGQSFVQAVKADFKANRMLREAEANLIRAQFEVANASPETLTKAQARLTQAMDAVADRKMEAMQKDRPPVGELTDRLRGWIDSQRAADGTVPARALRALDRYSSGSGAARAAGRAVALEVALEGGRRTAQAAEDARARSAMATRRQPGEAVAELLTTVEATTAESNSSPAVVRMKTLATGVLTQPFVSPEVAHAVLRRAESLAAIDGLPTIAAHASQLRRELPPEGAELAPGARRPNRYARVFDTAVADALRADPGPGALAAIGPAAQKVADALDAVPAERLGAVLGRLADEVGSDGRVEGLADMLAGEPSSVRAALTGRLRRPAQSGDDLLAQSQLAVALSAALDRELGGAAAPWMDTPTQRDWQARAGQLSSLLDADGALIPDALTEGPFRQLVDAATAPGALTPRGMRAMGTLAHLLGSVQADQTGKGQPQTESAAFFTGTLLHAVEQDRMSLDTALTMTHMLDQALNLGLRLNEADGAQALRPDLSTFIEGLPTPQDRAAFRTAAAAGAAAVVKAYRDGSPLANRAARIARASQAVSHPSNGRSRPAPAG